MPSRYPASCLPCYRLVPPPVVQCHLEPYLLYDVVPLEGHQVLTEQALRRFADAHKVLYGSRTEKGAKRTAVTMSIHETCKKRGVNFYEFVRDYLAGRIDDIPKKRIAHATTTITTMAA